MSAGSFRLHRKTLFYDNVLDILRDKLPAQPRLVPMEPATLSGQMCT